MRRMMARATADEDESAIDITPMLDVVFIMLIFFIVTATFVKEAGIDVNRPDAATAVKQEKANILDRKSTRLNSSHEQISYAVFCLKKKNKKQR